MSDTPKSMRHVNRADLATLCDVSLPVVDKWVAEGAPFVSRGSKGVPWCFDVAAVFEWRLQSAVKKAVAAYQNVGDDVSKEEADRRRAVAMAIVAEVEADQALGAVVYVEDVGRIVEGEYGVVRQAVLNSTARTADRCFGKDRTGIKLVLDEAAEEVLSHLSDPDDMAGKAAKASKAN